MYVLRVSEYVILLLPCLLTTNLFHLIFFGTLLFLYSYRSLNFPGGNHGLQLQQFSNSINSWYDLQNASPKNPFDLIAYATLNGNAGQFEYSNDFLNTGGTWVQTPISIDPSNPALCSAWETDNMQMVGDALMWTQQHQIVNTAADLAIPLQKMIYLRGGIAWRMDLPLLIGDDLDSLQLSFLENAGTRGDAQGTIPVIRFNGPIATGAHKLTITVKNFGQVSMGLKSDATTSGDQGMMEMDWIIVR